MRVELCSPRYQRLQDALFKHVKMDQTDLVLDALAHFQNEDGGFAHGLEPDIQMPCSNVASTDVAVTLLEDLQDNDRKRNMIQKIITYYESVFNYDMMEFEMVPPNVDDYPHAIWWNYDSLSSFTFGNPNPEVAGFLYQYQEYLQRFPLAKFVEKVVSYLLNVSDDHVQMHTVISYLLFYKRVDHTIQDKIRSRLESLLKNHIEINPEQWGNYNLEPYKVYRIVPEFMKPYKGPLQANIEYKRQQLSTGALVPNWSWNQYDDVFQEIKYDWIVWMKYEVLQVIKQNEKQ